MDGGAWWAAVHGVANSRTRLSDFTFTFHFHALENPRDGGAWWAAIYGVAQSRTRLKELSNLSLGRGFHKVGSLKFRDYLARNPYIVNVNIFFFLRDCPSL